MDSRMKSAPTLQQSTALAPGRRFFTRLSARPSAHGAWPVGAADSIDWQSAHAGHRYLLQNLICTTPVKADWDRQRHGYVHPLPWELEVQSHLRNLKPPVATGTALLLGLSGGRVLAASHFGFDSSTEQFIIWAAARAVEVSGTGVGDALLEKTLYYLRNSKLSEGVDCGAFTRIDYRNKASQAAFTRAGFECLGEAPGAPNLQMWMHPLDL
jgi:hypothetical protein